MNRNMGKWDRGLRAVAGIVLIGLAVAGPQWAWAWIGVVPLATAAIGWCPLYSVFGIRTCRAA